MRPRVLFVSTYPELTAMAGEISRELGVPMDIYEGGIMRDGHLYAKKREKELDVIISCGATAAAIKEIVAIPVVSVETGTVDFLNALIKAKQYGDRIGLVSYKTERLENLEYLKDVLQIDFIDFPYSNKEELERQIEDAMALEKLTVVSMGNCVLEVAAKKGLRGVLIHHSRRAVEQAIIAARNISDLGRREKERAERLKAVIDYSGEGIVAVDRDGNITTFNPAAEKIFDISASVAVGRPVSMLGKENGFDVLNGERRQELGRLIKINNTQIVLNKVPIVVDGEQVGTVFTLQEVSRIQRLEHKVRKELYSKGLVARYRFEDILGQSSAIRETISKAKKFGRTSTTVLIEGETGSGKELFAQSIHNISSRRDGPFVAINCAALPENLLESELFGYEEGAFTGAKKGGKPGLFELAHGGTIFLDEISQISPKLQSRLLRVLQEKEVLRVGGDYILNIDARVIAATNHNLYQLVQKGEFREDLFFRINVLNLRVPPLRERKEDIPILARHLLRLANQRHGTKAADITEGGMALLKEYNWPGNVRELENFAEKMAILAESLVIDEHFIRQLLEGHAVYKGTWPEQEKERDDCIKVKIGPLRDMELQLIEAVSSRVKGDKKALAERLGISRTTLWKRLKELEDEGR